jgi:hypothetical protein
MFGHWMSIGVGKQSNGFVQGIDGALSRIEAFGVLEIFWSVPQCPAFSVADIVKERDDSFDGRPPFAPSSKVYL